MIYRNEINLISDNGYVFDNTDEIIDIFEKKVSSFWGSKYAVAVDSCSNALFLALKYINTPQKLTIPTHTYVSVPMQIKHAGYDIEFENIEWEGSYKLNPLSIYDSAGKWARDSFQGGFELLSFQYKKIIPIGKGGMILTDDFDAYRILRKMRHDGRTPCTNQMDDDIDIMGYHMNMTPEDAARGILLMDNLNIENMISHRYSDYRNLNTFKVFSNG